MPFCPLSLCGPILLLCLYIFAVLFSISGALRLTDWREVLTVISCEFDLLISVAKHKYLQESIAAHADVVL